MCPLTTEQTASGITPGHINDLLWDDVVDLAKRVRQVVVAGFGEPLTNRRCLQLLEQLNELGVHMSLVTNGTALTPDHARRLAALQYLAQINISIDSPDPAVYFEVRGGQLDKALRGTRNLMAALDDPNRVTVSSVLMDINIASLADFPRLLAELGVKKYVVQGLINYTEDDNHESMIPQELLDEHIPRLQAACEQFGIELILQQPDRLDLEIHDPAQAVDTYYTAEQPLEHKTKTCMLPWDMPYVDKDGKVYPCCFAASKNTAVLGDMRQERLETIWRGELFQQFRRDILDGRTTPAICRECVAVPFGLHPLHVLDARLDLDRSELAGQQRLRLVAQNMGTSTWTQADNIRIATINQRERSSAYYHPSWIAHNRVATFREQQVPPGGYATFEFLIAPNALVASDEFQLLADGRCYLPNTRFTIHGAAAAVARGSRDGQRGSAGGWLRSLAGRSAAQPRPIDPARYLRARELDELLGAGRWTPLLEHADRVLADLPDQGDGSFEVRAPAVKVEANERTYHAGERAPAGGPATVFFEKLTGLSAASVDVALTGAAWQPVAGYPNGVTLRELPDLSAGAFVVNVPIYQVDSGGRSYRRGERLPAGQPATVWFDRAIEVE
jgi:radical SAM protein with 4Fe4S-binding SPASM domain